MRQSRHYHLWHHHPHHKKVHIGTLIVYTLIVFSLVLSNFYPLTSNQLAYAATQNWDLGTAGDYTYDSAKVEFIGGAAQVRIDAGNGADGAITVSANKNINTDNMISGRSCADGGDAVNYSVTSLTTNSATLSSTPSANCLSNNNEILLMNLQGTSANGNVGNQETLRIQSISSNTVTFTSNKTKFYGDGASDDLNIGTTTNKQRVILQRVPNYTNVTINPSVTLTASAWNGTKGGVVFFRANGTVTVDGTISVNGLGYRGGSGVTGDTNGNQGESVAGAGSNAVAANSNGGGGGYGHLQNGTCNPGGGAGGGHAAAGTNGPAGGCGGGAGGAAKGSAALSQVYFGGGGGAGGGKSGYGASGSGGTGGGIIIIYAGTVNVAGGITSNGTNGGAGNGAEGNTTGGGGAGGSIKIVANSGSLLTNLVAATKGAGGSGGGQGDGSDGRIGVGSSGSITGTTNPAYTSLSIIYPTDNPTVVPNSGQQYVTVSAFSQTLGSGSTGNIKYQISHDNGNTWYWWSGSVWATTTAGYSESNTAADINSNISSFTVGSGTRTFKWRAYLNSDGTQIPKLDLINLMYVLDTAAPPNPSSVTAKNQSGGSVNLTSGNWYNYSAPNFSWTASTDAADTGAGEVASGIQNYFVYFGIDSTADPATAGTSQTGISYTVSSALTNGTTYYLRIKTRDNAGNTSSASTLFTYKYDATVPTNPGLITVSPSGYSSINSYTFLWPSSGASAATDSYSGVAGYQYKTGATSGTYASYSSTTTASLATLSNVAYQEGANTFYLRVIDNAGNVSEPISTTFYYAGNAPSAPQNVTVSPSTSAGSPAKQNSFTFSWSAPATYNGSIKHYHYSVNALPAATNTTKTTSTSLAAGPFATQQGKNALFVVAEDEAGNINYNVYGSVDFYAQTPAPGAPTAVTAVDGSNRDLKEYKVFLSWTEPSSKGTGFAGYEIYRSTDGTTFTSVGTTTGTTFADTNLESRKYSYSARSKDNAGQYSAVSSIVSITPTGKYTSAPKLTDQPTVANKAFSATISWETDRESSSIIKFGKTQESLADETSKATESVKKHSIDVKGLEPETIYHYQAIWIDSDGNQGKSDVLSFQTGLRPKISDVKISNITLTSATVSWTSTTIASSAINYGKTTDYGSTLTDQSGSQTTNHAILLTNLDHSSTYHFQLTGTDTDGNTLASDDYTFNTLTKPAIANLRFETVKDAPTTSLRLTWTTNVPTTSIVVYSSPWQGVLSKPDAEYKTDHDLTVANLADQATYTLHAKGVDQYGNEAVSDVNTFTTPYDSRPPKVKNLTVEIHSQGVGSVQKAQIVAAWETDEPATSQIEYGPGVSSDSYPSTSQEDQLLSTTHVVIVSNLDAAKLYHLRAVSRDGAGNAGYSVDTTAITGRVTRSVVDLIANSLERSFGWLSKIKWFK